MRTGSLINHIADTSAPQSLQPEVGMGATRIGWSDRNAGTIVAVSPSRKTIVWQRDIATRTDGRGMSEMQEYTFERNPDAVEVTFTLRKDGAYRRKGDSADRLILGVRNEYHDFSF